MMGLAKLICEKFYDNSKESSDVRVFNVEKHDVEIIKKGMEAMGYEVTVEML